MALPQDGILTSTLTEIYSPTASNTQPSRRGRITNIKFTNEVDENYAASWTLSVYQRTYKTTTPYLLYSILMTGDDRVVNDDSFYEVQFGGAILAKATIGTVAFSINGNEITYT